MSCLYKKYSERISAKLSGYDIYADTIRRKYADDKDDLSDKQKEIYQKLIDNEKSMNDIINKKIDINKRITEDNDTCAIFINQMLSTLTDLYLNLDYALTKDFIYCDKFCNMRSMYIDDLERTIKWCNFNIDNEFNIEMFNGDIAAYKKNALRYVDHASEKKIISDLEKMWI